MYFQQFVCGRVRSSSLALALALVILLPAASFAQQSWGSNIFGQLGNPTNSGTTNFNQTPLSITGVSGLTAIAAGTNHALALKSDGTVWAWGYNLYGAIGNPSNVGTTKANPTPTQVPGVSNIKGISGGYHSLALGNDGSVWAWGSNQYGQLGNTANVGTTTPNSTAAQVSGISGVAAIAAGVYHSLALKTDGTVWAWGDNIYGQLGNQNNTGTTSPNSTPVQVSGLPTIVAIAAGQYHSLAIANDGTVWAWGANRYGQLGNTTNNNVDVPNPAPRQVSGISNVTAVAAGASHTLARTGDGTVWAWGLNTNGQLGNTTNNGSSSANPAPVQIANFSGVATVASGDLHSLALKSDGTVWTWGFNQFGQLGNNAHGFGANPTPVQVVGLAGVVAIAGGVNDSFALPPPPVAVTIASGISGSTFSVTGMGCQPGDYTAPQTLQWLPGSSCLVSFTSPQSGPAGTQYVFSEWADSVPSNPRTISTPASPTTYTAQFQMQYLLTAASTPVAGGFVTGAAYYNANTAAAISATANPGYNFSSWTGPVASATSASTTVQMTGPVLVTANFVVASIPVTIASSVSGLSFSVSGTGCQPGSYATPVTLSWTGGASCVVSFASPQAGGTGTQYLFSAWDDASSANPRPFSVPASATTYTANFQTQYLLTVSANPAAAGAVSGSGYYNAGGTAPVTATANSGFAFLGWAGPVTSAGSASTTVSMTGPQSVTANFNVLTTIASAPAGLSFSVSGAGCQAGSYSTPQVLGWTPGSLCAVSFMPAQAGAAGTQYVFSAWQDSPSANPRSFSAPAASATYTADFQTQYLLTVAANPAGAGSVSGGGYYNAGSNAPVTAAANAGFTFVDWTGAVVSAGSASTAVAMTGPLAVTANFSSLTTISSFPVGLSFAVSGTGCDAGSYSTPKILNWTPGSSCSVSFAATQAGSTGTQYVFAGWADGPSANPRIFAASGSAITYMANFQRQYLLTTSVGIGGSLSGTISAGGYYNEGTAAAVSATANAGYQFTGFSGDLSGLSATQSITMNAPHSVVANFGLITSLAVGGTAGKYSDAVSLSATLLPAGVAVSGSVQFTVGGVPVGSVAVNGGGTYTLPYVITQKQGSYAMAAVFTSSTAGILGSAGSSALAVSLEDAAVTPSAANPAAVLVSASGGTAQFTLTATIQEVADGSAGDITNAKPVTFTLNPVIAAPPISCAAASGTLSAPNTLTVSCSFTNVPVNVYDVGVTIGGDYYTGSGKTIVSVYDPSLGFINGNGGIVHNGAAGSFQVNVKYRNDGSLEGSFGYTEQRPGGVVTVSDAGLRSASVVGDAAVLVAPVTVNGAANYTARAVFVNNAGSGKSDTFALQVMDGSGNVVPDLTFGPLGLTQGNVHVH